MKTNTYSSAQNLGYVKTVMEEGDDSLSFFILKENPPLTYSI